MFFEEQKQPFNVSDLYEGFLSSGHHLNPISSNWRGKSRLETVMNVG